MTFFELGWVGDHVPFRNDLTRSLAAFITDFLFTSVAVPLCLATDRLKFFVVNNHLTDGQSGVLLASFCFIKNSANIMSKYLEGVAHIQQL